MPSFFITTTARDTPWYPWAHANYIRVLKAAETSVDKTNTLANHPRDADVIVFVEAGRRFQSDITLSPLYKAYPEKSMVLDFADNPFPVLPGLYVGMKQSQPENRRFQGGFYIRVADNPLFLPFEDNPPQPDLLFSFKGRAQNHPVRGRILALQHPRAIIRDQSSNQSDNDMNYVETLYRSKFVLSPRGYGPSSWRLFETLRAGRVPVIVSDDWQPPEGVEWEAVSLRIQESDIEKIPRILESLESHSEDMGRMARREWERCFSYEHSFEWIASRLNKITSQQAGRQAG